MPQDDIIFVPPGDEGQPGEYRIADGEPYITCVYIKPGQVFTLPSGRTMTYMRIFVDECLTKLYIKAKARDN